MSTVRRSSLFLMELLAAILFFFLCAAVCLSVIARAHEISLKSEKLTAAVNEACNAAELLRSGIRAEDCRQYYPLADFQGSGENFTLTVPCSENAHCVMTIQVSIENKVNYSLISITDKSSGAEIYSLRVSAYQGGASP